MALHPTFDGDNLVVILPAGISEDVDIDADLYSEWKEWFKIGDNAKYPRVFFESVGNNVLTDTLNAGSYFFFNNVDGWRIRPAEEDRNVTFVGQIVPIDGTIDILTPTLGAFTVLVNGLQPITQNTNPMLEVIQNNQFLGQVHIDTANGAAGTQFPKGSAIDPVDNLADALTIAAARGLRSFKLRGSITLLAGLTDWEVIGLDNESAVVNLGGQSVAGTRFERCSLDGSGSGAVDCTDVTLLSPSGIRGVFRRTGLETSITLGAGKSVFYDCFSEVAGLGRPIMDFNSLNSDVSVRGWFGGIEVRNVAHASADATFDMATGAIELAATCTLGTIVLRGVALLTDSSSGSTVSITGLINPVDVRRTAKAVANRQFTDPVSNDLEIQNDDDTGIEQSVPLYEDDGVTPWAGINPIRRRDKINDS